MTLHPPPNHLQRECELLRAAIKRRNAVIVFLLIILGGAVASAGEQEVAAADRRQFPQSDWGYYYYLTTANCSEWRRQSTTGVARFVLPSLSRAVVIERQLPTPITPTLSRIDLRDLEWNWQDWHKVLSRYPYSPANHLPLVVRADWLIVALTDNATSDSGYRLLYGTKNIPRNRDEFLKFWQVSNDRAFRFGWVEGSSGVAVAKTRWLESRPTSNRGYAWGSRDSAVISDTTDPLEHPDGTFKHDAEEWIVGIPKWSQLGGRGTLQVYLLTQADGKRINRAPITVVEDHSRFRGVAEIRNTGSCMQCHVEGIIRPTVRDFQKSIIDGVDLYASKKKQEQIDRFFSGVSREIDRNCEDFTSVVQICNGWDGRTNAANFRAVVNAYDAPVTLETAARELYGKVEELRLALAYASAGNAALGVRLSGLPHGRSMSRAAWERQYSLAWAALKVWEAKGR